MAVVTLEQVSRQYGEKPLIDSLSFVINEGEKIGLIGVNGTGKSTLLRLIARREEADRGTISYAKGLRMAYLPQNPSFEAGRPVLEQALAYQPHSEEGTEYLCKQLLTRLGIQAFDRDIALLSGGQRKRVALAAVLSAQADLLILDEPTNHLDAKTALWLEEYLIQYRGTLLLVTHDRYFLERVVNRIAELQRGKVASYPANYSKYLELKAQREEMAAASERKRQALLKKELEWLQRGARARGTKAQFRVDRAEELKAQKAPETAQALQIASVSSRLGKKSIEMEHVGKSYEGETLFSGFSYTVLRRDRLGIVGENGCGKSTLLKLLCGQVDPDEGKIEWGETVKIGYVSQEGTEMDPELRVYDYIQQAGGSIHTGKEILSTSQMLERFLFPPQVQYNRIGKLSGGERRRLYLLRILMEAPNILLLDEPTNDLDIETLTVLEDYLEEFNGAVIAVSHDRYFLDKLADHLFAYEEGKWAPYTGGYSDYLQKRPEEREVKPAAKEVNKPERVKNRRLKFSYREQKDFEEIDGVIASLEEELSRVQREIEGSASDYMALNQLLQKKGELEAELEQKTERWVYLNELAERIEKGE